MCTHQFTHHLISLSNPFSPEIRDILRAQASKQVHALASNHQEIQPAKRLFRALGWESNLPLEQLSLLPISP